MVLSLKADLRYADWTEAILSLVALELVSLVGFDLSRATLKKASLFQADLE